MYLIPFLDFGQIGPDLRFRDIAPDVQIMKHAGGVQLQVIIMGRIHQIFRWFTVRNCFYHYFPVDLHIHKMFFHG